MSTSTIETLLPSRNWALVTGGTSGIGLGITKALCQSGLNVIANGLGNPAELATLCESLSAEYDTQVLYDATDLSDPDGIEQMIANHEDQTGPISVLVNNAGIQLVGPIEELAPAAWDRVIAVNLSAAYHTIHHILPHMKARNEGRIINIASAHGLVASPYKAPYVAAKHGLVGLSKVVALETAELPITCNTICPGWVYTPLVQQQVEMMVQKEGIKLEEAKMLLLAAKQPTKEFVTVEDIGAMVVYLCGHNARHITGAALSIDGGWTAQ